MKGTVCLLAEGALQAGRQLKADSVFLIVKGSCAIVEGVPFHFEGYV